MSEPKKITELFAWVAQEPDGGEGVMAMSRGYLVMPLIGGDRERVESLRWAAEHVAEKTGAPYSLRRFHAVEVIESHPAQKAAL